MGSLCTIWNNKVGQEPFSTSGIGFLLTWTILTIQVNTSLGIKF